jgi:hypothetical protein
MKKEGFLRWIEDADEPKYAFPAAEYNMAGTSLKRADILERAQIAADCVKPKPTHWILVTESAGGLGPF